MVNLLTMELILTDAALVYAEMCIFWTSGLAGFQEFGSIIQNAGFEELSIICYLVHSVA